MTSMWVLICRQTYLIVCSFRGRQPKHTYTRTTLQSRKQTETHQTAVASKTTQIQANTKPRPTQNQLEHYKVTKQHLNIPSKIKVDRSLGFLWCLFTHARGCMPASTEGWEQQVIASLWYFWRGMRGLTQLPTKPSGTA